MIDVFTYLFFFWGGGRIGCCHWSGTKKERERNQPHKKRVSGRWSVSGGLGVLLRYSAATSSKKQTDQPKVQGEMNFSVRVRMRVAGFLFPQDSVLE